MVLTNLVFLLIIFLSFSNSFAQETTYIDKKDFDTEIMKMQETALQLKKANTELKDTVKEQNKKIDGLFKLIQTKEDGIQKNVDAVKQETQARMLDINQKISLRTVLWIVIIAIVLLLFGAAYIILRRKLLLSSKTLDKQIIEARETLEADGMKLDNKLMGVLETQLQLLREQAQPNQQQESEVDHSLALRVGEEIHRMRKRIANMPEDTKGLGALKNSLSRLEDEFNASGYQIVDLLGKTWNDGLTVSARFIPSDDLKPGEEIITKVIKPQINFKGVLIKTAELEVSTGG